MIRTPEALIPYLLAAAAVAGGLLWNLADEMAAPGQVATYGTADIGGPFALTDQNGKPRTDADYRGKFMLIYFGYTHCPDVCPVTLSVMAQAIGELGPAADHITPIFVSVDPARDTPAAMKAYVASFGPKFVGLTGSERAIAAVAREYRVFYKRVPAPGGYEVNHSSQIYLMDPNGGFLANFDETIGPDGLAKELRARL